MTKSIQENDALRDHAADASALLRQRKAAGWAADGSKGEPDDSAARPPGTLGQFIKANLKYIAGVALVTALAVVCLFVVAPLVTDGDLAEETYVSPYDWQAVDRTAGRFAYVVDGQVKSRLGVDVSENQHVIDWQRVAADGVDFAMIRLGYRGATQGDLYLDEYYSTNLAQAQEAGLDCGVYFFSQANSPEEAVEEADFVLEHLGGAALEYPIAFDSEERVLGLEESRVTNLDPATMTAVAQAFCQRIQEAGYDTMIYGNGHDIGRFTKNDVRDEPIWWAEYGIDQPSAKLDIEMWQYANGGQVAGIDTAVDMNIDLRPVLQELRQEDEVD